MKRWKRTLAVIGGAQLVTMIGFSAYMPTIPYYFQELGNLSALQATRWTAAYNTAGAVTMMIASPIWGALSDRHGRKVMLVRATFFGSLMAFLLGFARTPAQLVALRALQGIFSGTVSAAMTLVATQTPEENMGTSLGIMQTIQYVGLAIGPLIGGLVADAWGMESIFPASSALMAAAVVAVLLGVKEHFQPAPGPEPDAKASRRLRFAFKMPSGTVLVILVTMMALSLALALLSPVLSLFVKSLSPDSSRISTLAGSAVSVAAVTSSIAALVIGRLGDKYGQRRILLLCAAGVALVNIPQALVRTPAQLIALRAVQGIFIGGIMPTATALLATNTPVERRGTIFGLSNSMRAGGRTVGPLIGAGMANLWGMRSVFLGVSALYALITAMIAAFVRPMPAPQTELQESDA